MQVDRGLRLGRPFGHPLVIHISWLPAVALLVTHFAVTVFSPYDLLPALLLGTLAALIALGSVVAHEVAHAAIATRAGLEIDSVTLHLTGGITRYSREPERAGQVLLTAAAGPVVSGGVGLGALVATGWLGPPVSDVVLVIAHVNIALAAINVLPGLPFDGGHFLWASLWISGAARYRSIAAAARWGQVVSVAGVLAGLWLFYALPLNGGAAAGLLLAVLCALAWAAASSARRAALVTGVIDGRSVAEWGRPFAGRVGIDDAVPKRPGAYAVADDGHLAGVVMAGRRGGIRRRTVRDVMIPWHPELSCTEDARLAVALAKMSASRSPLLVILGTDGVVRGVLREADVRRQLGGR